MALQEEEMYEELGLEEAEGADADHRYGHFFRTGAMTIGVVIHSDSTVAGHGPGVTTLLTGHARHLVPRAVMFAPTSQWSSDCATTCRRGPMRH